MKQLTKAKIINRHFFWNQTIEFKDLVFLTGKNASGKSTLIDALELVLLGDTSGRFFNKAAMDKSARTLKGYLRGELGDDSAGEYQYLRNGRFTSYIALEFYDDIHEEYFVMGIVFDSFVDGSEEHHFFSYNDKIPENEFIVDKYPMEYKALANYLNEHYHESFRVFDTNKQYLEYLKMKFGGLKDKYFSLLKKASSFSPITDITTFITEYVCEKQENIELDSLQSNILEYRKLEVEAERLRVRVSALEEIEKTYGIYTDTKISFDTTKYLIEKADLEISKDKLNAFQKEIEKSEKRLKEIDDEILQNKSYLTELDARKIKLISDKSNNDVARLTSDLYEQKRQTEVKIKEIEDNENNVKNNLNGYCDKYISTASKLIQHLSSFSKDFLDEDKIREIDELGESAKLVLDKARSFKGLCQNDILSLKEDELFAFRDDLTEFKNNVSSLAVSLSRSIKNIEKKIQSLKEEGNIKQGEKSYDPRLLDIKQDLAEQLKNKFNKDIPVEIYADLIDIKDLTWSNAIEGFLSGQKFNLFVPPKYYLEAYRCLSKLLDQYRFYQTSLVDEEKVIDKNFRCEPESLAEEISTKHEGAKAYTNFLIGRLHKSKTLDEARESGNGITKACDLYRNYGFTKINPRLYQNSFIGSSLDERFAKEKQTELQNNLVNLDVFKSLSNIITNANNLEILNSNEISNILSTILSCHELKGLRETLKYIKNELSEHDTTLISSLDKRIEDVESDLNDVKKNNEDLVLEKGNLTNEINNLKKEKIRNEEINIREKEKSLLNNYSNEFVLEIGNVALQKALDENKSYMTIYQENSASLSRLNYLIGNVFNQLVKLRTSYCHDYRVTYDVENTSNEEFDKELKEFRDVTLPQYLGKIQDSYNKATQQFKDDFIFKLRSAIEEVEDQIENLNSALKESPFGDDLYRFTVKPSVEYRRYYDMLKDDIILETNENDESLFLEKYKDVMEDLFKQIIDNGNSSKNNVVLSNIQKFTDYRSYLDFDLKVYNRKTNIESSLSKVINKKSGGETQIPFYISVVASFAQLYHVHEEGEIANTIRLIIFDEAFSKMDREKIIKAVKLLRKFNLQVILSAPPEKIGDISELVDETLLVTRDKKSSYVLLYSTVDNQ